MKNFFKHIRQNIAVSFAIFASFCSISSLVLYFIGQPLGAIISLVVFFGGLCVIFYKIIRLLNKNLEEESTESAAINGCAFVTINTENGIHYDHEVYKPIQSKRVMLTEYEHEFKWLGNIQPQQSDISSCLQDVGNIISGGAKKKDKVILILRKPLPYNKTAVIHVLIKTDDSDNSGIPVIGIGVTRETDVICFKVVLKHLPITYNRPAIVERRLIDTELPPRQEFQASLAFDHKTKSFTHYVPNPTIGYSYSLRWEKQ